jgi:hypothetical protein
MHELLTFETFIPPRERDDDGGTSYYVRQQGQNNMCNEVSKKPPVVYEIIEPQTFQTDRQTDRQTVTDAMTLCTEDGNCIIRVASLLLH